jgi:hypothetical protein
VSDSQTQFDFTQILTKLYLCIIIFITQQIRRLQKMIVSYCSSTVRVARLISKGEKNQIVSTAKFQLFFFAFIISETLSRFFIIFFSCMLLLLLLCISACRMLKRRKNKKKCIFLYCIQHREHTLNFMYLSLSVSLSITLLDAPVNTTITAHKKNKYCVRKKGEFLFLFFNTYILCRIFFCVLSTVIHTQWHSVFISSKKK